MKIYALLLLLLALAQSTVHAQQVKGAEEVVRAYFAERESVISAALGRDDQDRDFAYQLSKERQLLNELAKPGNERIRLLVVLHAKSRSLWTVAESIADEQAKGDQLSASVVSSYQRRLQLLREDIKSLERELK